MPGESAAQLTSRRSKWILMALLIGRAVSSRAQPALILSAGLLLTSLASFANPLDHELGRAEVRVFTAPFSLADAVASGQTVEGTALVGRLEQLGYRRVRGRRPSVEGEFFWGNERFWIFRRGHFRTARWQPALLLEVMVGSSGRLIAVKDERGRQVAAARAELEPLLIAETLRPGRAARLPVVFEQLPEVVWRTVVASEDARFFDHGGVDSRSLARAVLANARKRGVAQGGSTITQQLIKHRELTPRRTVGRKISEALRALALETEVDKSDILENYLNSVYYGHIEGVEIYGLGAAARAYFSKQASELTLAESALLAGLIQSPNRLSPVRNPQSALKRRHYVLDRLRELGWAEPADLEAIRARTTVRLRISKPTAMASAHLLAAIRFEGGDLVERKLERGRGLVVETHLDPWLQQIAAEQLQRAPSRAKNRNLEGAFVAGNVRSGEIVAYVGSTQTSRQGELDRARRALRQPGSTVKPLVVLEALERCGRNDPLTLATLVADEPLTIELASGPWSPRNSDLRSRGVVDVRRTLMESLNQPTVRLARHCGFQATADRFAELGLASSDPEQPAFVLGAVEVSPRQLLSVYARLAGVKRPKDPRALIAKVLAPDGAVEFDSRDRRSRLRRVPSTSLRFLIRDALEGAASSAGIGVNGAWGKTGTSSDRRDAWFAGGFGDFVAVVWLGTDDGHNGALTGALSGARNAAPIFGAWMDAASAQAGAASTGTDREAQRGLVRRTIDAETGLVLKQPRAGSRQEWFVKGSVPPKRRWWRPGATAPVIQ